eukprot:XP_017950402.1 PREDICTED: uncharacterized protein LOC108644505 [Xenopus tropicalis]
MANFDPLLRTELIVDASPVGLGAILVQYKQDNPSPHIISYASRSLTTTEMKYSQSEKESLAVVWGCEHFHLFIYGAPFTIITDHQALITIFGNPRAEMPARIERWGLRLQGYDYKIVHRPGKNNNPADYISRHPTASKDSLKSIAEEYINFMAAHAVPKALTMDMCGTITEVSTGSITVPCEGMAGYYVTVLIRHSAEYLQLREVEVYGEESADYKGVNLARRGEVAQSSTFISSHVAETAIDGIKLTDLSIYPCAHTNDDKSPWWRLDLKSRFAVEYVFLVYRMDDKRERLLGAEIRIGDSADNKNAVFCLEFDAKSEQGAKINIAAGQSRVGPSLKATKAIITLCCEGMEGRYVSVVIPGRREYLQLCEVEVYGEESTAFKDNLVQSGEVSQSSTYRPECGAAAAVDGVKGTNPHTPPCTHTQCDPPAWWRLDLKKRYNVQTVIVTRMEQSERLRGAEIRVGDFENNNNPVCGTITDVSQANITLSCNGTEGRYVSVVIPGREEYLQLCEVEVYGEESINQEGKGCGHIITAIPQSVCFK